MHFGSWDGTNHLEMMEAALWVGKSESNPLAPACACAPSFISMSTSRKLQNKRSKIKPTSRMDESRIYSL